MTVLEIKKGELNTYLNFFNPSLRRNVQELLNQLETSTSNQHSYNLKQGVNKLDSKKDDLQTYFPYYFNDLFFNNITDDNIIEKISDIGDFLTKYQIDSKIKKIVINENISEPNQNNDFIRNYIFSNEIEIMINGDVSITNINQTNYIKNISIKGNFEINNTNYDLKFENFDVSQKISIENLGEKSYNFVQCKLEELNLSKSKGKVNEITLENCSGNIDISNLEINKLLINNSEFNSIRLNNNIFKERVKISSEEDILKKRIDALEFRGNSINGGLRIGHLNFGEINIYNLKNLQNNEINIGNINVDSFTFSNVRNLGKIRFYDINFGLNTNSKDVIDINNSSFGDSEFQNVNLNSFKTIKLYDTLFSGLIYTGVQWGYRIKVDKDDNYGKLRNSYRVLKDVSEKNNDNITALRFFSEEMKTYKEYLKFKRGSKIDLFIVRFNEYTSNFGLNFVLPVFLIIILHSVVVIMMLLMSKNYGLTDPSLENFTNFVWYFSNSFNITNNLSEIIPLGIVKEDKWLNIIVVIKNIIYGALVYQTIQAFRKFSRKV